jgi:hypothetical protein
MAVGDVYRLTIEAIGLGHQFINTYAFTMKNSLDPTEAEAGNLATSMKEITRLAQHSTIQWRSWKLQQVFGGDVTVVPDECRRDGGRILVGTFSTNINGGVSSGDMLPPQCAMVWTISTGLAGRRRRGRSYMYGFPETAQANGTWFPAHFTAMQTALNTIYGLYGSAGSDPAWLLGVWSERVATGCRVTGSPPRLANVETPHPELAFNMSTSYVLRPNVHTQRRRALGVGR